MGERDNGAENDTTNEREEDDERDDEDEDEDENGTPELPPEPVVVPRQRRPRAVAAPTGLLSNFGGVPEGVTHWSVKKRTVAGTWEHLAWAAPGSSVALREWPLADLSEATLEQRWGLGAYQVSWVKPAPNGGRHVMRGARVVEIVRPEPVAVAAPPAPVAAPSSSLGGLEEALRVMAIINQQADAKLANLASLATLFQHQAAPPAPTGVTFEQLQTLLREEREANARAIAAAFESDDDDDENPIVEGARAIARPMFRGKAWWQQLGNFANENPEVVKSVVPMVLSTVQNVAGVVAAAVAKPKTPEVTATATASTPPPPPPATPKAETPPTRPRAVPSPAPEPEHAPVSVDDRNDPPPFTTAAAS